MVKDIHTQCTRTLISYCNVEASWTVISNDDDVAREYRQIYAQVHAFISNLYVCGIGKDYSI